ncbi:MAG TPA: hypothetical protein VFY73_15600 [Ideonella sp.]|uniref:hypothetical protein n=1 Tax=Ideonella sp. TaxID=1929293 RepID=UPI002E341C3B|nr:hypothetical protein [Ideonella sp.]HEX5685445.1 hypothetical protein [Ideonella sp.]
MLRSMSTRWALGCSAVFCAMGNALAALPTYRITEIPVPPGWNDCSPTALNERGQVLGFLGPRGRDGREQQQPFIWSAEGGLQLWPTPARDHRLFLEDINDAGQVVGSDREQAFIWTSRAGAKPLVDRPLTYATAINERGLVTGFSSDADKPHAFLWSRAGGMVSIHPPTATVSFTADVNNLGQAVGQVRNHAGEASAAILSRHADPKLLGCLTLSRGGRCSSLAWAINDAGQVVGHSSADDVHAFFWSEPTGMVDISADLPTGYFAYGEHINSLGQVVGTQGGPDLDDEPFYWDAENGRHRLADLIDPADPLRDADLNAPAGINTRGEIVVSVGGYRMRMFLLTPVR